MANDINEQKPWKVNQVTNNKPNVPRTEATLSGYFANSMNGGHNKPIFWQKIMAGQMIKELKLKGNFQMLTPLTPTYQNLTITFRAYFVPNSRIWKNAEKYTAQRGGSSEVKIQEIPNLGGKYIPQVHVKIGDGPEAKDYYTNLVNTEMWRDSFISSYLPRIGYMYKNVSQSPPGFQSTLPKVSVLPLRGHVAIWNDMFRNKEYESEKVEYNDDTVSNEEWLSYLPYGDYGELINNNAQDLDYYNVRAKRPYSYYTDYRTEIQGFELAMPTNLNADKALLLWSNWESKIAEARSQAELVNATDWDIIAKIRGSKVLTEGKVQLIGQQTVNLNYAAITQNTYNNNQTVREDFRVMGKQGAYSYTEINIPLFAAMEFKEEGYLHIYATVSADTVLEKAFDRNLLNVTPLDEYRPDLEGDKYDVLYQIETGTSIPDSTDVIGYKRRWTEYFKLPNVVGGDMTTDNYFTKGDNGSWDPANETITQKTFQFFEQEMDLGYVNHEVNSTTKKLWKDYTDLMINKNQAIQNKVVLNTNEPIGRDRDISIAGQNQIFFVGVMIEDAILPINTDIDDNYTTWGEH